MSINKPDDLSNDQINDLVENGRLPMTPMGKALFDYGAALLRARLRVEKIMRKEPEIDLRRRYDISVEYSTSAPRSLAWSAIDLCTYDPPLGGMFACIGRGPTPQAARFDLLEQLAEYSS